jgi:hypothetical protein
MILITDRIHTVLPTLISRCQIVRFAYHRPELIAAELAKRFNRDETDPHIRAAATANTLGDALVLMEEPDEEVTQLAIELWDSMGNRNWDSIAQKIDSLAAMDNQGFYEKLFLELARLIRNAFLQSIGRAENYFTPEPAKFNLQSFRTPEVVETLLQLCQDAIGSVRVFGNISLISINFVISIMELSDGQK